MKNTNNYDPDYPLQGHKLDITFDEVFSYTIQERENYIVKVLTQLAKLIEKNEMALKARTPFAKEMRDLRSLLRSPADKYLYTDEKTFKRDVLGKGSPGATHAYWSRKFMWRMATRSGDLTKTITTKDPKQIKKLIRIINPEDTGANMFRSQRKTVIQCLLGYMQMETGVGTAFPPFHAKFLAERFLPKTGNCLVIDPCAGWGGRLLGSLCVKRSDSVTYVGIDPEKRNKEAYEGIVRRLNLYMKSELPGKRLAKFYYKPFEDWISSITGKKYYSKADLVITSPPYFSAENYNTENKKQSANKYLNYAEWREHFYKKLVLGAFDLLKPGGIFVLNIANVASAPALEKDARSLAKEIGFINAGFYKMAMSVVPGTRNNLRHSVIVNGSIFKHEPVFCFQKPLASKCFPDIS